MARPTKKGLDYFPLDVDFLSDIKVRRIIRACGKESIHILIALLSIIYREDGYYMLWNDDLAFLVADEVGAKEGTVDELINKSVQVGFFDKTMFDKYQILTSKAVQTRYIAATKERKEVVLEKDYLLTNEVNRSNISINRSRNPINQGSNQQSKAKQSKAEKSKENSMLQAREQINQAYQQKIKPMDSAMNIDRVQSFLEEGVTLDVILFAIDISHQQGGHAAGYVVKKLNDWVGRGVKTVEDAKQANENWQNQFRKPSKPKLENTGSSEYDNLPF